MDNPTKMKLEEKRMKKNRLLRLGIAIILSISFLIGFVGCATTGTIREPREILMEWPCPDCSGLGRYVGHEPVVYCSTCEGKGYITIYRTKEEAVICADCGTPNCRIDHEAERRRPPVEEERPREPIEEERPRVEEPVIETPRQRADSWTVTRTNSLWNIAARPEIYGDGNRWREIYDANRDQIRNPDLIFPGQVLVIPR